MMMLNEKSAHNIGERIHYKGIKHNVLNDAPFIGAIVIARHCHRGCKNCINEHLKQDVGVLIEPADAIIQKIKRDPLNEGVIFSGLEWSEQPEELLSLVSIALNCDLKVMIYTHHEEAEFFRILPELKNMPVLIKFGFYDVERLSDNHFSHGIKLASSNQYIKEFL